MTPWSGSWWPMCTCVDGAHLYDDNGPMEKYDDYVDNGGLAKGWEYQLFPYGHRTTDPSTGWYGHCNGWSAAAILEAEPTTTKVKDGVTFTVGAQKGLLSECHNSDPVDLGVGPSVSAATFHKVLIDWIGDDGEPVVMDIDDSDLVDNQPAYAYTMTYTPDTYDPYKVHVKTEVTFARPCYPTNPDCVGTDDYEKEYRYWITGPIYAPTNGGWESSDKPDSVWHPNPDFPTSGNPYVSYSTVQEIVE